MPSFRPKTDAELAAENIIPKGEYGFEIMSAANERSKSGSDMIHLKVGVYLETGACRFVDDYLVFVDKAMFKVSNFCKCVGLYEQYKAGNLDAEDCRGRSGKCKVDIEPAGEFQAKNKITSYVVPKAANADPARSQPQSNKMSVAPAAQQPLEAEDDAPF